MFCASHKNILPNVYPEFRALPKLWNNMMINASNHNMLILNDDITITDVNFFNALESLPEEQRAHVLVERQCHLHQQPKRAAESCGGRGDRFTILPA